MASVLVNKEHSSEETYVLLFLGDYPYFVVRLTVVGKQKPFVKMRCSSLVPFSRPVAAL